MAIEADEINMAVVESKLTAEEKKSFVDSDAKRILLSTRHCGADALSPEVQGEDAARSSYSSGFQTQGCARIKAGQSPTVSRHSASIS